MNALRLNPWASHLGLFDELSRLIDARPANDESTAATADWIPTVDIEESADRFVLHADVPGVDPETIEVQLENGVLTISGQRESRVQSEDVQRRRVERSSGHFFRRFSLPDSAENEGVTAASRHGVLEITIPKRQASLSRKIAVSAS